MKETLHTVILMLGMTILIPGISFARDYRDSIVMHRVWNYHKQLRTDVKGMQSNTYIGYTMSVGRRNALLWLVPTMYSIAHGDREFVGEAYGKLKFQSLYDYQYNRQVKCGTIPHHRKPITALFEQMVPNVYGEHLYGDRLLSPFHAYNKKFYKYRLTFQNDSTALVRFKPRIDNTQLISGEAVVNARTGCLLSILFKGEFDMIKFNVSTTMNPESPYGMPKSNRTNAYFKFLGNRITADFTSVFDCATTLPDSNSDVESRPLMDQLRPVALPQHVDSIYRQHHLAQETLRQEQAADTLNRRQSSLSNVKDFFWDVVGDHMINSTRISKGKASMRISPLFNPLYMSYSSSKGVSYKLKGYGVYKWDDRHYLTLEPYIGYATKLRQFYYTIPLVMTYHPKRNGMVGITWGNGNHTSNGAMAERFNELVGHDSIAMPEFRDEYISAYHNIALFDWVQLTTGLNYHLRTAVSNHLLLQQAGLKPTYRSFAPFLSVHFLPWQTRGPMLTVNYERSIMNLLGSNLSYERWEYDASYKHRMRGLRILNLRGGAGFYTQRSTDYFVDYTNFRDENLPTGWEDDWTGQFQLVDSRWYNESNYYLRAHVSYDSPLLCLSWLPAVGRFIESERLYFSALSIERTRPYYEVGYGLKCRYFSTAVFASFLQARYNAFECKFTFELFRRW